MIYKIEFRPGVSRQIKKVAKEVKDWVFEITGRLAFNPTPKNSKSMTNSPYRRIKPDRHIDSLNTKQYKSVQNFRLIYLLNKRLLRWWSSALHKEKMFIKDWLRYYKQSETDGISIDFRKIYEKHT